MSSDINDLVRKALELPPESRAELADVLVESLDAATLRPLDHQWVAESRRRRNAILSGSEQAIDGAEGQRQVRDSIK